MERKLLNSYKEIFKAKDNSKLDWVVHKIGEEYNGEIIHCPVPFVGKDYAEQKTKILLYASAENFANYENIDTLYCDEFAINRHRNYFNKSIQDSNVFFPNVHIQPVNDGGLAIVALYIFRQFNKIDDCLPKEFLEKIAIANYCKYTAAPKIKNKKGKECNVDYPNNKDKLAYSHEYIKKDIEILKPDYIIMPRTIYYADNDFIKKIKGTTKIIPIYQINATTINTRINTKFPLNFNKDDKDKIEARIAELDEFLQIWYKGLDSSRLKGKTKVNFLSVFDYLDDVIKNEIV